VSVSISPKQQLVDLINFVIGDVSQDIGEPRLRINAVELSRFDQRVGDRR
jgi:hypothetical protein